MGVSCYACSSSKPTSSGKYTSIYTCQIKWQPVNLNTVNKKTGHLTQILVPWTSLLLSLYWWPFQFGVSAAWLVSSELTYPSVVPTGSCSRGGGVAVYAFDINQPSLSMPFYSVIGSISVFMALSVVFHSINSPDNSPLSHRVLGPLKHISLYENLPQPWYNSLWLTGLKALTN